MPSNRFFVYWAIAIGMALLPSVKGLALLGLMNAAVLAPFYAFAMLIAVNAPSDQLKAVPPQLAMGIFFFCVWTFFVVPLSLWNAKPNRNIVANFIWYGAAVMLFLDAVLYGACPIAEGLSNGNAGEGKCFWPGMIISNMHSGMTG